MLLLALCLLLLVLLASFLSSQGFLSSLLVLVSALFALSLSFGTFELLTPYMNNWYPEYSRGLVFLLLFFFVFSSLRFAGDYFVKKDVKMPVLVNRIGGGVVGLFAGWIIIGTIVMGLEMFPLPESIAGSPVLSDAMAPASKNVHNADPMPGIGIAAFPKWLAEQTCGGALGGSDFTQNHPDFTAELTGYRHAVQNGARTTLDASLVKIRQYCTLTAENLTEFSIPAELKEGGRNLLLVSTSIDLGGDGYKGSAEGTDKGNVFMASTTQIRLVTNSSKGQPQQYYPIGYLENGFKFVKMPLASGYVVDDYASSKVLHDWVFSVAEDQKPTFIEIKAGGRADFPEKENKTITRAAVTAYPPHKWKSTIYHLNLAVKVKDKPLADAFVVRMQTSVHRRAISDLVDLVYKNLNDSMDNGYLNGRIREMYNGSGDLDIKWQDILPLTMMAKKKAGVGIEGVWKFAHEELLKDIKDSQTYKEDFTTSAEGTVSKTLLEGEYVLLIIAKTDDNLYVWVRDLPVKADTGNMIDITLNTPATFEYGEQK